MLIEAGLCFIHLFHYRRVRLASLAAFCAPVLLVVFLMHVVVSGPEPQKKKMADDPKEPEEGEEGGGGEDVEAEANVEFKPLIEVRDRILLSALRATNIF